MAQIVPVTSEALEAQIRQLLPSQRGFGEDLQASNVIMPIIDLTAAAQGTITPANLQTALAFGSQTGFIANATTDVIANAPGFYRIFGVSTITQAGACTFEMTDGLSTKTIWVHQNIVAEGTAIQFDFVAFLAAGESISTTSTTSGALCRGSSRQIADVNGNLVYPVGFTPQ